MDKKNMEKMFRRSLLSHR